MSSCYSFLENPELWAGIKLCLDTGSTSVESWSHLLCRPDSKVPSRPSHPRLSQGKQQTSSPAPLCFQAREKNPTINTRLGNQQPFRCAKNLSEMPDTVSQQSRERGEVTKEWHLYRERKENDSLPTA